MTHSVDLIRGLHAFCRSRRAVFFHKSDVALPDEHLRALSRRKDTLAASHTDAVRRLCAEEFGAWPEHLVFARGLGTFRSIFAADMGAAGSWIVRAHFGEERDWSLYVDAHAATVGRAVGVPVPEVRVVDVSRTRVPFDFEILAAAEGRLLTRGDPDAETVLWQLGQAMAKVHRLPTLGFGLIEPQRPVPGGGPSVAPVRGPVGWAPFERWSDFLLLNLEPHLAACRVGALITADEASEIEACFDGLSWVLDPAPSRLLHGDLGGGSIFAAGGRLSALIDWEDCLSGDPVFDIAAFSAAHPVGCRGRFLAGYRDGGGETGEHFDVRYWLYRLRIALARTVQRWRFDDGRPASAGDGECLVAPCDPVAGIRTALDALRRL